MFTRRNIVMLLAILVALFGGFRAYSSYSPKPQYETVTVKRSAVTRSIMASGEIGSADEVDLRFPVSGKLVFLAVKKNDHVKRGDYLGSLDKNILQAQFEKSRADWVAAVHNLKLKETQFNDYFDVNTKEKEIQTAKAGADAAWNLLQVADFSLKNADLASPIDGVVTNVQTPVGTSELAGTTTIVTIANLDKLFFIANIGEADISDVAVGQVANVTLDAFADKTFSGKVSEIDYAATTTNGGKTYQAKITLDHLEKVKLDMSGDVKVLTASHANALAIPKIAVQEKNGDKYVEVLEGKQNKEKVIETGIKGDGGTVEIVSGVNEGERIIIPRQK